MYAAHPNAHTRMTQEWIDSCYKKVPIAAVVDPNTGQPTGNFRVLARASFVFIFERGKPQVNNGVTTPGKYGINLLVAQPDLGPLKSAAGALAISKWPDAGKPGGPKLHTPFLDQAESERYEGYVPGLPLIRAGADKFQPYCVDQNMVPVTDPKRLYSGCWVVASINPYIFDKGTKKGVTFGINGVMIVADDTPLGGSGGSDPSTEFAGVQIDAGINPAAAFGASPAAVDPASLF